MNETVILLIATGIQSLIIIYTVTSRLQTAVKSEEDRGRRWVCTLYYREARHIPYIERQLEIHSDGSKFDRGAQEALIELKRREVGDEVYSMGKYYKSRKSWLNRECLK